MTKELQAILYCIVELYSYCIVIFTRRYIISILHDICSASFMPFSELDYSFLIYGENFERAGINGEKLFNITRQKLTELGIIRTDHQDIILKAVCNINKKVGIVLFCITYLSS